MENTSRTREGGRDLAARIERFIAEAAVPALVESGEAPIRLEDGSYFLEQRGAWLVLQAWDQARSLARRVTGVREERPGRLELSFVKLGGKPGRLLLVDQGRPQNAAVERKAERRVFRDFFRLALGRQFPGWTLGEISTEPDLENSLSPSFPRAFLVLGKRGMAAIASPPGAGDAERVLSHGLIWLDYLRRREPKLTVGGLALFLPAAGATTTCLRLRWLDPEAARYLVFVYEESGVEQSLDLADTGNLATRLENWLAPQMVAADGDLAHWTDRLSGLPEVEAVACLNGELSLRVRGLEFARRRAGKIVFGIDRRKRLHRANYQEAERLALRLGEIRCAATGNPQHPWYQRQPEAWLESMVRGNIHSIDASLMPEPVYGQVPAFAAAERGILDLLAIDNANRLAVIELKATEELHLPLQALDYWLRVEWHNRSGEFTPRGYFPGRTISRQPPRLLLVAPALHFHPTTEKILRFFHPSIEVSRVGVSAEWHNRIRVLFRLKGSRAAEWSAAPGEHQVEL